MEVRCSMVVARFANFREGRKKNKEESSRARVCEATEINLVASKKEEEKKKDLNFSIVSTHTQKTRSLVLIQLT